jgi:hypothetical protein
MPPPFPSAAPHCLYLDGLAVAPGARRGGAGRTLLAAAARLGARWGARGLWLHVRADNYPALALYRSLGFRTVEVVGPPFRRQNLMRLALAPAEGGGGSELAAGGGVAAAGGAAAVAGGAGAAADGANADGRPGGRVYLWARDCDAPERPSGRQ